MSRLHKARIRQLRTDARRLETVAKHLRDEAKSLALEDRAEARRHATFHHARSSIVDAGIDLFTEETRS